MRGNRQNHGFSLLELLAVITIIGIISAIVLARVSHQAIDAKKKSCLQYKSDINSALEHYRFTHGSVPNSVNELQGDYYPDVIPKCPVTNEEYLIDSASSRVLGHVH